MKEEDIQLLRRIRSYLFPSDFLHAVYIPPAQQLRNQADEIEQKAVDRVLFNELINKLEANPLKP